MRYAVFSDIHSNLEAYEAVLAELSKEKPDRYFCGGDIVGYGANPHECIAKTRGLSAVTVAGNHDWGAAGARDPENFTPNTRAALLWTAQALGEEEKGYLKGLPILRGDDFTIVHGSPNRPEDFEYVFGLNHAYRAFLRMREEDIRVCFIGHTHAAGVFMENEEGYIGYNSWPEVTLQDNRRYIINTGSVGQPRDNNPDAAYCIYDADRKTARIKRVRYDVEKAQRKIISAGLPRILAERLSLGK
jgi:predicted phosphodiesterase